MSEIDLSKLRTNWLVEDARTGHRFVSLNLYREDDFVPEGNLRPIRPATQDEVRATQDEVLERLEAGTK